MEVNRVAQGGVQTVHMEVETRYQSFTDDARKLNIPTSLEEGKHQPQTLSAEEAKKAVDGMNKFLSLSKSHLKFEFHEKLETYYVTIIDDHTNEVIREIPPKKLLDITAAIWEQLGLLIDHKI